MEGENGEGGIINSLVEPRFTGIYDTVDEKSAREAINELLSFLHFSKSDEESGNASPIPVEFIVSTHGGVAVEMFAVYDVMRLVRNHMPLCTFGVGKVMSSGLLLLAAGTKGQRMIGKNTRLMFHDVVASSDGHLFEIEDSLKETKKIKDVYHECLAAETNLTRKQLKSLINRRKNIYFSAEEAVEWGFADLIV